MNHPIAKPAYYHKLQRVVTDLQSLVDNPLLQIKQGLKDSNNSFKAFQIKHWRNLLY